MNGTKLSVSNFTAAEKSNNDLFEWAKGRKDCEITKIKLPRETSYQLFFNGKLIAIK